MERRTGLRLVEKRLKQIKRLAKEYQDDEIEKILADYFYHHNIPYKYEKPIRLEGYGIVYPDFTFLSRRTGKELYWEHEGRMDDPGYARKAIKKIESYESNGIYVGDRLILTFETEATVLSRKSIERNVKRYLM